MSELNLLFKPKTVAMIGASANENKWGHIMLKNLIENGYSGNIIPINPKGGEILNKKVYRKISDVKETIDVALCGVPTTALRDVVMDCSKGNLKYLIIFTAGTAEVGHEGLKLQKDLVALANKSGIRIVGPNCMGLLNHSANLNLTGENGPPKGNIALLAQSGNIGFALFHEATRKNIGLSSYISVGNQADIPFHEYMSYLKDDSDTKAIIVYMEGLKNAKEFKRVVNETVKLKPVIVYKAGSSIASKRSALSHTGSMTGDDKVFDGYFKQINVIRLDNCDEMLDIANALVSGTFMTKNRVALVGGGGGHATSLADLTTKYNLDIPELSERTQKKLKEILLKDSVVKNPIDFVGASESSFSVYEKCTRICLEDANIDGVLIYGLYGGYRVDLETEENNYDKSSIKIAEIVNEMKKPVVMHSIYANEGYTAIDKLRENKVPVYDSADMAAKCMGVLYKYGKIRKKI
jgi:acyl-CoA synthetase (NDP forming)